MHMDAPKSNIGELLVKHLNGSASVEESEIVTAWIKTSAENQAFYDSIRSGATLKGKLDLYNRIDSAVGWQKIQAAMQTKSSPASLPSATTHATSFNIPRLPAASAHRVHFLRRGLFRYAAAVLLLASATLVWYSVSNHQRTQGEAITNSNRPLEADVAPGGEKAMLTLADGSTISLDSAASGQLADQGGVKIIKSSNGGVVYDLKGLSAKDAMWNTMSTPKGGQYQVTLPDGTKAWLNASSSITFPAAFVGNKRQVRISGELYFEVARNNGKPFVIDVNGVSTVQVLGTSFNINAYTNEGVIKTTLVDGSVKVDNLVVLKPGQQAVAMSGRAPAVTTANLEQALAWKNGIFYFNGADLHTVMRELERWYDIKVEFKGSASNNLFKGKIYRNMNLSDVVEMLNRMGVKLEMHGKNLVIL